MLHCHLRLLVKAGTHYLHPNVHLIRVICLGFVRLNLIIQFLRNWDKMCFPKRRLAVVVSENNKSEPNLFVHFLLRRKSPPALRDPAWLLCHGMNYVISRSATTGP